MAKFTVTYDDFSGGQWVGGRSRAKQPKNTYEGLDMVPEPGSGYLMPTGRWTTGQANYNRPNPVVADATYAWYADRGNQKVGYYQWPSGTPTDVSSYAHPPIDGDGVLFDGKFVCPAYMTNEILVTAVGDTSTTPVSAPDDLYALCVYDAWIFGASFSNPNRLYYCDAYDPATWASGSYYDVGSVTDYISRMVQHNGGLYIATNGGWYVGYGIPGETFSLRKLTDITTNVTYAVDAGPRIFFTAMHGRALMEELSGTEVSEVGWGVQPGAGPVRFGRFVVVKNLDGDYFLYDTALRIWIGIDNPGSALIPPHTPTTAATTLGVTDETAYYYRTIYPSTAGWNGSTFDESTALLADYMHKSSFRVREAIAEVELDTTNTTADRTVKVAVLTPGHPDMAIATASAAATTEQTYTWNVAGTGQIAVARLTVNDHPPTYLAQPRVKLAGVKLRRLILVCEET